MVIAAKILKAARKPPCKFNDAGLWTEDTASTNARSPSLYGAPHPAAVAKMGRYTSLAAAAAKLA